MNNDVKAALFLQVCVSQFASFSEEHVSAQVPSPCQNISACVLKSAKQLVHKLALRPEHVLQVGSHFSHLAEVSTAKKVPPGH